MYTMRIKINIKPKGLLICTVYIAFEAQKSFGQRWRILTSL